MRLLSNSVLTVTVACLSFDFAVGNLVFGSVGTPSPDSGLTCDVNQWDDNKDKFACGGPNGAVEGSCITTLNCCWDGTTEPFCYAAHQETNPMTESTTIQSTVSEDTTTALPEESTEGQSTAPVDIETTPTGEDSTTAQTTGSSSSEDTTTTIPEESTEGQSSTSADLETTSPVEESTTAQTTGGTSSSEDTTAALPEESTEGQSTTSADLETTSPVEESTTAQTTGSTSSSEDTTTSLPEESTEGQSTAPADLETTTPIKNSTTTPITTGSSGMEPSTTPSGTTPSGTTESSTFQCYDSFSAAFSTENNCVYYSSGIIAGAVLSISLIWVLIWYCACRTPATMDKKRN